jgi:hypothetical protein
LVIGLGRKRRVRRRLHERWRGERELVTHIVWAVG